MTACAGEQLWAHTCHGRRILCVASLVHAKARHRTLEAPGFCSVSFQRRSWAHPGICPPGNSRRRISHGEMFVRFGGCPRHCVFFLGKSVFSHGGNLDFLGGVRAILFFFRGIPESSGEFPGIPGEFPGIPKNSREFPGIGWAGAARDPAHCSASTPRRGRHSCSGLGGGHFLPNCGADAWSWGVNGFGP